jgi:Tfp pilus assembly protein PilZ
VDQKRRSLRVANRFIVFYGPTGTLGHVAQLANVSAEGVALKGKKTFAVGTVLRLSIRPGDQKPLELDAKVAWVKNGEMGLRLVSSDPSYLAFLSRATGSMVAPAAALTAPTGASEPASMSRVSRGPLIPPPAAVAPPAPTEAPRAAVPGPVSRALVTPPPAATTLPPPPKSLAGPPVGPLSSVGRAQPPGPSTVGRVPRLETQLSVRLGTTRGHEIAGIMTNISRTGLAVLCRATFLPGTRVTVVVTTEDRQQIRVGGQIVWTKSAHTGSEVGVRIVQADDAWARLIEQRVGQRPEPRGF